LTSTVGTVNKTGIKPYHVTCTLVPGRVTALITGVGKVGYGNSVNHLWIKRFLYIERLG